MTFYIDWRPVSDKPRWIIVDGDRNIINRSPTKDELKGLKKFPEKAIRSGGKKYTDEELLNYLIRFYKKYGRPPTNKDFTNNSEYPGSTTYVNRFGSWANALKKAGLDVESMIKRGVLVTIMQKGRLAEILVRDHFEKHPVDLAGKNSRSPCDGICPNGLKYDVKSSGLYEGIRWTFPIKNKYKEEIEIYYFLAFNNDYTKLKYVWRVPAWEIVEKYCLCIGMSPNYEFNIENMREYDITDKLRDIIMMYGLKI